MRSLTPIVLPGDATEALEAVPLQQLQSAARSLVTIDPGTVTYDGSGPDVEVAIASKWGHDGTDPYFNDSGVTPGEEAALVFDPATHDFAVVPYEEASP